MGQVTRGQNGKDSVAAVHKLVPGALFMSAKTLGQVVDVSCVLQSESCRIGTVIVNVAVIIFGGITPFTILCTPNDDSY